ncbi:hypothetical protein BHM03_00012218 [Ensete ventricosum]|nr:hypothetical protein BHM03_00012218 [Ensete ventricosum]
MVRSKRAQPEEGEFEGSPSQISPGSLPSVAGVTGSRETDALEGKAYEAYGSLRTQRKEENIPLLRANDLKLNTL